MPPSESEPTNRPEREHGASTMSRLSFRYRARKGARSSLGQGQTLGAAQGEEQEPHSDEDMASSGSSTALEDLPAKLPPADRTSLSIASLADGSLDEARLSELIDQLFSRESALIQRFSPIRNFDVQGKQPQDSADVIEANLAASELGAVTDLPHCQKHIIRALRRAVRSMERTRSALLRASPARRRMRTAALLEMTSVSVGAFGSVRTLAHPHSPTSLALRPQILGLLLEEPGLRASSLCSKGRSHGSELQRHSACLCHVQDSSLKPRKIRSSASRWPKLGSGESSSKTAPPPQRYVKTQLPGPQHPSRIGPTPLRIPT